MNNNAIAKMIEFVKMEKKHKESWLNLKEESKPRKIELFKKHHNEKADLCLEALQKLQKNGFSEELMQRHLEKKLALHEEQIQDWVTFCQEKKEQKEALKKKNDLERENFKKSLSRS